MIFDGLVFEDVARSLFLEKSASSMECLSIPLYLRDLACAQPAHRMYLIRGKVREGRKRGKSLGYPTANVAIHKKIPQGIYISETLFENSTFPSVSFVGNAKTFGEKQVLLETFILDFDQDIYGRTVIVRLLKKIRENEKFESGEKLVEEIKRDVEKTKAYFKSGGS